MNAPLKQKRKGKTKGRPRHRPTEAQRRQVKTMIGFGIPLADVSACLLVDARTLRKYYGVEIETGRTHANSQVAQALFKNAIGTPLEIKDAQGRVIERHERAGNVIAQIFWLKCRGGGTWVDKDVRELTGPNGLPLNQEAAKVVFTIPVNGREERPRLSAEDRKLIEQEVASGKD
mgnify:CR=1 FL=1